MPTSKPRVLTLIDHLGIRGGAEQFALEVATRLDPEKFDRTLCVSRWGPDDGKSDDDRVALGRLEEAGVRFLALGRRRKADVHIWGRLIRHLRRERVDILHAHKFGSNVWGTICGTLARTPVVISHEHSWSFEGKPHRKLLDRHLIARGSDAFLAVSAEDQRRMIAIERIPPDRVTFIPIGLVRKAPPQGKDVRGELGIPADAPVAIAVGFLRAQKDYGILVRAAAIARERHPELRVVIVGEGEERPALEALVAELGQEGHVLLIGRRSDVPELLHASDICCNSSDFEGTPMAILEYMGAGKPTVATSVGGVPDLIEDGVHGRLVPKGDADAFAAALVELLDHPDAARAMGERARERQLTEFDIDVMIDRYERLYENLLVSRSARSAAGTRMHRRG